MFNNKLKISMLVLSIITVVGCKNGNSDTENENNPQPPENTNNSKSLQNWVPERIEYYANDGSLSSCIRNQKDSDGYLLSSYYSAPNADGAPVLCVDEDPNTTFTEVTYNGERTQFTTYSQSTYAPNVDCSRVTLNSLNFPTKVETFISGSNNYICSVDTASKFSLQTTDYDSNAYETQVNFYTDAGPDGVWETADDIQMAKYSSEWSSDHLTKDTIVYYHAGADGIWGTADDVVGAVIKMLFKSDLIPDHYSMSAPGADNLANTADDITYLYAAYNYENETIKSVVFYNSPGLDGNWDTLEDNEISHKLFY